MATVEIPVWIDENGNVFSKKMLDNIIKERTAEELRCGSNFNNFICYDYTAFDLFTMNEEARAEVWKKYEAQARRWAEKEIKDFFREQTIEVDINISN